MSNPRTQSCNNRCVRNTSPNCNEMRSNYCSTLCGKYPKVETAKDMTLAMAYVRWQSFGTVYEPDKALQIGTIFPELFKPYTGCKGGRC